MPHPPATAAALIRMQRDVARAPAYLASAEPTAADRQRALDAYTRACVAPIRARQRTGLCTFAGCDRPIASYALYGCERHDARPVEDRRTEQERYEDGRDERDEMRIAAAKNGDWQ